MSRRILPYYLTYPMPYSYQEEDNVTADLEYMMQMYPQEAKDYQKRIMRMLDKMDYRGSFIYDDYPDKVTIYRMADQITTAIVREAESTGDIISPEKKEWIHDLVLILLFYEIYRRRHTDGYGFLKF
ncbi:MAG: hypothetical protein ACI4F8_05530 [Lachnospiraceae bacterium]